MAGKITLGKIEGAPGKNGADGKSAYQYAVDGGYAGTEDDFKALLGTGPWLPSGGGTMQGDLTLASQTVIRGDSDSPGGSAYLGLGQGMVTIGLRPNPSGGGAQPARLYGVADPTNAKDAANRGYVDESISAVVQNGIIVMWSGAEDTIPDGWALCNGQNGTPDLSGRFIVGAGGNYEAGDTGGADEVTLTVNELPAHDHTSTGTVEESGSHSHSDTFTTTSSGSHTHGLSGDVIEDPSSSRALVTSANNAQSSSFYGVPTSRTDVTINSNGSHSHSISGSIQSAGAHTHALSIEVQNTGAGNAHENRPPFYALCFIMKVGV